MSKNQLKYSLLFLQDGMRGIQYGLGTQRLQTGKDLMQQKLQSLVKYQKSGQILTFSVFFSAKMSRPQQSSSKHILFQRRKLGLSVEVISGSIEQSWVQLSLPSIQLTYFFLLNLETSYFSHISMLNIDFLIRLAKCKFLREHVLDS